MNTLRHKKSACMFLVILFSLCACDGDDYGKQPDNNPGLPPYISINPDSTGDGWTVSTPEAENLDPTLILNLLENIRDERRYPRVDALLIARNGHLVAEAYFNGYGRETIHDVRSVSKSITSALAGIAMDQGMLNLEETLGELISSLEDYKNPDDRKAAIKIIDLLNMSSGLDCNDWLATSPGNEEKIYRRRNWLNYILDLPMAANPGELARYCTGGVILLGSIIATQSGMDLDEFADIHLFSPLGIEDNLWYRSPDGQATGGGGLRLRPRDLAKFGQLFLNNGLWNGERVISEEWVSLSKSNVVSFGNRGYGLLWWKDNFLIRGENQQAFFASGNGGNFIFLFPEEDLVVVFTGRNFNSPLGDQPFSILQNGVLPAVN